MTAASQEVPTSAGDADVVETPLSHYAPALASAVAERAGRFLRNSTNLSPSEHWVKALNTPKSVDRLLADLPEDGLKALSVFRRSPSIVWRWDHAMRLLAACGVDFCYPVAQGL